jgi:hypothetical protein
MLTLYALCGCATRYDQTGYSRVGIGLWNFGDPPGVNWNLDWPRRDPPELPPAQRPDLPPTVQRRGDTQMPAAAIPQASPASRGAGPASAIDDNRARALHFLTTSPSQIP